ncbi:hypothetical protein A8H32_17480 [Burkholderia thailandensis]|nr:hypothetical protein AQ475_10360 [Burkholderia thailandensis]AVR26612.1 hypothetical protein A8H32_17480 [Burkholderia thailandensis]
MKDRPTRRANRIDAALIRDRSCVRVQPFPRVAMRAACPDARAPPVRRASGERSSQAPASGVSRESTDFRPSAAMQ